MHPVLFFGMDEFAQDHPAEAEQDATQDYPQSRRAAQGFCLRGAVRFADARQRLEVAVRERANSRPICSGCGRPGPGYDRLPERRYEFVPLWALAVFLVYAPRRVDCPRCGVKVERVPWAEGKSQLTTSYRWFLASWAKLLPWQQVANVFHTSWQSVYRSVEMAVAGAWPIATWRVSKRSAWTRCNGGKATAT